MILLDPKYAHNVGMVVRLVSCYGLGQVRSAPVSVLYRYCIGSDLYSVGASGIIVVLYLSPDATKVILT